MPARGSATLTILLDGTHLDLDSVRAVAAGSRVEVGPAARTNPERAAAALARAVAGGAAHYGINTGFGPFARTRIDPAEIETLQLNLIRSHAVGYGDPLPVAVVRAMLVLRAHSIARGYSGVGPAVVDALVALLNAG